MNQKIAFTLATIFFLACLFLVKTEPASWNDSSRLASIESLVERGTWAIDESSWVNFTQDKIFIAEKFYSDKMPLFSFLGAGVYEILRAFGGSVRMDCAQAARFCAYAPLTLLLVTLPASILIFLFFDYAARLSISVWAAVIGTVALGLGTMIFPYALVLNHHVPAAAAVFASYYLLNREGAKNAKKESDIVMLSGAKHLVARLINTISFGATRPFADAQGDSYSATRFARLLFFAGFLAALAPSFDVLSGIVAVTLFGIAALNYRARALYFVLGALVPLAATALLDYQIARTLLPPYTVTDAYNFPGSAFPATVGGNGTPDDYAAYAFRMFLGGKGLFAYNPLLIFAFVGALTVAFNRASALRVPAALTALGFIALCVYLATQTGNYGGTAYGERWFVVAIPILFSFIFFAPPLNARTRQSAWYILFVPLLALSIISSLQGAQTPWQDWLPPLQMTRDVSKFPYLGFKWNWKFP